MAGADEVPAWAQALLDAADAIAGSEEDRADDGRQQVRAPEKAAEKEAEPAENEEEEDAKEEEEERKAVAEEPEEAEKKGQDDEEEKRGCGDGSNTAWAAKAVENERVLSEGAAELEDRIGTWLRLRDEVYGGDAPALGTAAAAAPPPAAQLGGGPPGGPAPSFGGAFGSLGPPPANPFA